MCLQGPDADSLHELERPWLDGGPSIQIGRLGRQNKGGPPHRTLCEFRLYEELILTKARVDLFTIFQPALVRYLESGRLFKPDK